jgi:GH18 family chitinase
MFIRILITAMLLAPIASENLLAEEPSARFCAVGYLPDYRLDSFDSKIAQSLTDLVAFSAEPEANGELNLKRLPPKSIRALRKIKQEQKVRLILCVGGWERSKAFPELAAAPTAVQRFAKTLTDFCAENQFDGVDLDWEHPKNETDRKNCAQLLIEVKKAFAPKKLLLTIAMAGWQVLPAEAFAAIDRIHLMAYDAKGRHATAEFAEAEVARLIMKGAPRSKICLGLPFYGKSIADPVKTMTYAEILKKYKPMADVDEVDGIYFNGIRTIEKKTRYAIDHKLAGVMIWEVGQDVAGERSLVRAIGRLLPLANAANGSTTSKGSRRPSPVQPLLP